MAGTLRLIPSAMAGKRWLKRLFLGRLVQVSAAVDDGMAAYVQPVSLSADQPITGYKILFAIGRLV